jgi:phosphodiesterase/alkaline phosphatase D-like protein
MPSRIVFMSCSDPIDEPVQPVWERIAEEQPDRLVLLGDQIYMDFGILGLGSDNPPLGRPARMTNSKFASAMHERYRKQHAIMTAGALRPLLAGALHVHAMWDDHDFAWNNSYGDGGSNNAHGPVDKRDPVPCDKQRIARRLMRDFVDALKSPGSPYPANPFPTDVVPETDSLSVPMFASAPPSTQSVQVAPGVRLLLTDGRTWRTRTNRDDATVFGTAQWQWIREQMRSGDVILFASSSTLDQDRLSLDDYGDFDRLLDAAEVGGARVLCLTGDVHKCDWRHHGTRIFEAVASGAARSSFGQVGAYGCIDLAAGEIVVKLVGERPTIQRSIELASWTER